MSSSAKNSKGFIKKIRLDTKKPAECNKLDKSNERNEEEKPIAPPQTETQDELLERYIVLKQYVLQMLIIDL